GTGVGAKWPGGRPGWRPHRQAARYAARAASRPRTSPTSCTAGSAVRVADQQVPGDQRDDDAQNGARRATPPRKRDRRKRDQRERSHIQRPYLVLQRRGRHGAHHHQHSGSHRDTDIPLGRNARATPATGRWPQRHRAAVVGGDAHGIDATARSGRLPATAVPAFAGHLATDSILSSLEISGSLQLDHPVELLTTYLRTLGTFPGAEAP